MLGDADGHHQRHRQGRRHDRARHGDDARPSSSPTRRSPRRCCRRCSARACVDTFNAITVDSDTSTSDTLLLFATGKAAKGAPRIDDPRDRRLAPFRAALNEVLRDLAHQVVRDGEGARKFVEVRVKRRDVEEIGAAHRACRSPIRRWSRRRSPARTPIGAASSWPSARPASRPTATGWRSGSATSRVAVKGERDPGLLGGSRLRRT